MPIEILSRTFLPIRPIECDELARKADAGSHFSPIEPDDPCVGNLWTTPSGILRVWTGTTWLVLGAAAPPPEPDQWDGGMVWDGGETWK